MTNREKINNMSNEELANEVLNFILKLERDYSLDLQGLRDDDVKKEIICWLSQEAAFGYAYTKSGIQNLRGFIIEAEDKAIHKKIEELNKWE